MCITRRRSETFASFNVSDFPSLRILDNPARPKKVCGCVFYSSVTYRRPRLGDSEPVSFLASVLGGALFLIAGGLRLACSCGTSAASRSYTMYCT